MVVAASIAMLVFGVILTGLGGKWIVSGIATIAKKLNIPPGIAGFAIIAAATSFPELATVFIANADGHPTLAISTIIGSNILNIGFIIAITALIYPLVITSYTVSYAFPYLLISSFIFPILANDNHMFLTNSFSIGRFDGLMLLLAGAIFFITLKSIKETGSAKRQFKYVDNQKSTWLNVAGVTTIAIGGWLIVQSSIDLLLKWGLSETITGIVIMAAATSAPEIMTSISAARKKSPDIAVGTIIGSCIFNIFIVLGLLGVITPIVIESSLVYIHGMVLLGMTIAFMLFASIDKNFTRSEAATLLIGYIGYVIFLFM